MSPSTLWILLGLTLALPPSSYQSCSDGTPSQCLQAELAPGTNLAGEGFDITKMERKGAFVLDMNQWRRKDKTCTLCSNPYLDNRRQKLPLSVVDWRAKQSCSSKVASKLYKSSEALLSSSVSSVENNWKAGLDLKTGSVGGSLMLAGTNSKLSEYSMSKTKEDKFSFSSQSVSCQYYSYRVSNTPRLHREFSNALKQLPEVYNAQNKQHFYRLIDNFGTHYITKVKLGGSVQSVTSIQQCLAGLRGLGLQEVQACLEVEASASFRATASSESKHCDRDVHKTGSKSHFSSVFSDRLTEVRGGHSREPDLLFAALRAPSAYRDWLDTVPRHPDVVSYSLESLHQLLPGNSSRWLGLRAAIGHYVLERGLWRNCSEPCAAGRRGDDSRDPCACHCHHNAAVDPDCCPTRRGMAQVKVTAQRAAGLWGDYFTSTDGFVKVLFDKVEYRSPVINNNNDPRWDFAVDLGPRDLSAGDRVRLEVWDRDGGWDDDRLGQCEQVLAAGRREDVCYLSHGKLFFSWEVTCAPGLGGKSCREYVPSPMSPSLKTLYVSRHARPLPLAMLQEMGVFVDDGSPRSRNLTAE